MREIKFRGKRKDNGEWIVGNYGFKDLSDEHLIIVATFDAHSTNRPQYFTDYLVDPETVGQFTEIKDKHDKEIYEGDIVKAEGMYPCKVVFDKGTFKFDGGQESIVQDFESYSDFEIIGNMFDNPELAPKW